jgi:hypothetical protein
MDQSERSQRAYDAEDVALRMQAVLDQERVVGERMEAVRAARAALRKALRMLQEAEWDHTSRRTAYVAATRALRAPPIVDGGGSPLPAPSKNRGRRATPDE